MESKSKNIKSVSVVGGAGHIGLPLSCYLQNCGYEVLIIDNNKKAITSLKKGITTFHEEGLNKNLNSALKKGMKTSDNLEKIRNSNYVFVTIGTSSKKESILFFESLMDDILEKISEESFLILRSTVTIEDIEKITKNELFKNKKIKLAYCPERIAEGEAFKELVILPQIVGVEDPEIFNEISDFFKQLKIESIPTSIKNAVFIKLFSNAYRHANFSLANEFYNIANKNNIEYSEVVEIAKKDYPRLKNLPLTGYVGGPCLPKDLETFIKTFGVENSLLNRLEEVNDGYLDSIVKNCNNIFKSKKIIQLGLSFKNNSDDIRGSGSIVLYTKLIESGFEVYAVDPCVNADNLPFEIYDYENIQNETNNILITVSHDIFKEYKMDNKSVLYAEI